MEGDYALSPSSRPCSGAAFTDFEMRECSRRVQTASLLAV
jgi:hypothetical protein